MAPRASWKGFLRLSLVSVPVQAFNAAETGGGEVHFHQLHADCHSRIRYKKVCPIHGEVPNSEIVMGYEYTKDKYVVIEPDELDKLRSEADKSINIDSFVRPEQIDPMYYDGRTYYLVPDGPMGQKPYEVLHQAMAETERYAVAQAVFSGKEQLILVRPIKELLAVEMLHYDSQIRKPQVFDEYVAHPPVAKAELKLATTLI
jgi:DNA end-binding protein Ku